MGGPMRNPFTRPEGPRSHIMAVRPSKQSPPSLYSVATTHTIDRVAGSNDAPPVPSLPAKIPVPARKPLPSALPQTETSSNDYDNFTACVGALLRVKESSPEPAPWALQPTGSQQIVDPWARHIPEDTDPDSPPATEEEQEQYFFRAQAAAKLEGAWEGPLDSPPPFLSAGSLQRQQDRRIAAPSNLQVHGVELCAAAPPPVKASQPGLFRSFSKSAKQALGKLTGLRRQESSSGTKAVGEMKKRDSGMYYPNALPRKRKPSASPARTLDLSSGTSSSPSSSAGKGGKTPPAPRAADPVARTRKVIGHQGRVTQFGDFIDYASLSSGSQEESSEKTSSPAVVDLSTYQAPPPPPPPVGSASRSRVDRELPALPTEAGLGISVPGAAAEPQSPISKSSSSSNGTQEHEDNPDAMPSLSLQQKAWAAAEAQRLREKLKQYPNQSRAPPSFPLTPPTSPPSSTSAGAEGLTNLLAPYISPSSSEGNPETIIDTVFHPGHTSWRITGFSDPDTIEFFHGRVPVAVAQRQREKGKGMGEGKGMGARDEAAVLMERLERERWGG
ncbi:hypothetical protein KC332_g16621 [Hortaea werneckii]|nr:hypothetical protein KC358_g16781 [Hortaea werneckii]KAI6798692.1 hypothetical protein KC350_g16272 [Hortaea werneckii]KAI6900817.1 hypothetical protein KC348_g16696 [Hortaea werneckii]KAI6921535.1 hypothetical protein KC341_g15883 [Hortaea werneckii]KAI6954219.1 hypothetical protein KC321_g16482 [Hortaea werneckii]